MDSRRSQPEKPLQDDLPIEPPAVDEYTAALIRGSGAAPELWFRDQSPGEAPSLNAIAVLRSVDMLVRHGRVLEPSSGGNGKSPAVGQGQGGDVLVKTTPSEPESGDELLALRAERSGEAYRFLLSFRPDSRVDAWWPTDERNRPALTTTPRYSGADATEVINLTSRAPHLGGQGAARSGQHVARCLGAIKEVSAWLELRPGVSVVHLKAVAVQPAQS